MGAERSRRLVWFGWGVGVGKGDAGTGCVYDRMEHGSEWRWRRREGRLKRIVFMSDILSYSLRLGP